ncbi:MAG: prepilin-type N-terminal cleavage/methylation domain-containing protein [Elusimicrobiaceae bacterium]|nr:prepilin-type N-terminal cleavage/methylation domain-containing protein [Elusimicrobiaceae bacterium]
MNLKKQFGYPAKRGPLSAGFTLIELLVVVLIIGILSSVALPQYTKAVEKSRAAEAMVFLRHLKDMGTMYMLEHGNNVGIVTFSDLGVDIPSGYSLSGPATEETVCNKYWCFMTNATHWGDDATTTPDSPMARRYKNGDPDGELFYSLEYISQNSEDRADKGQLICTDDQAKWCSMFGTTSGNPIK